MIDVHRGTAESAWAGCAALAGLPPMDWGRPGRVVVVSPHPDDEILGAGATMTLLSAARFSVELIAVTDGEGSHPGSTAITPNELARRRPAESAAARARLGFELAAEHRLGLADGSLPNRVDELTERLVPLLHGAAWVLAPWRDDGHPDHEATGTASARAAAAVAAPAPNTRLAEYPVWAWNWARPDDERLPWPSARSVPMTPSLRAAKAGAIGAFTSQVERQGPADDDGPVLPQAVLAHFRRPFEVFFV